jgi:hypothetical protein
MAGRKMLLVNPKRRSTRRRKNPTRAKRRTPARRSTRTTARRTSGNVRRRQRRAAPARRRRRSNPARRGMMGTYFRPALMGAGGAVGIDVLMGYAPLPDALSSGMARHATKAAAAIGVGMFLPQLGIVKRATAEEMARGALTVYAADALREGVATYLPDVPLGYYSPAYVPPGQGDSMNAYLSEYVSGADDWGGATPVQSAGTGFGEYVDAEGSTMGY